MGGLPLNKYFIQETLFMLLGQMSVFYKPTKSNKKMILRFFESLPFLFFDEKQQNVIYNILKSYQISSYIDRTQDLRMLSYFLYRDVSLSLEIPFESYEKFQEKINFELHSDKIKLQQYQKNINNTYLFFIVILIIMLGYSYMKNNE